MVFILHQNAKLIKIICFVDIYQSETDYLSIVNIIKNINIVKHLTNDFVACVPDKN